MSKEMYDAMESAGLMKYRTVEKEAFVHRYVYITIILEF
jgi:hypothetical protein